MNTLIRWFLCAAAVAVTAQRLYGVTYAAVSTTGHVLVLTNGHVLEGDIDRIGDRYRIRRSQGGETWLPAEPGQYLCPTLRDAYQYLRTRTNPDDPDERLRLAEWCHQHELHAEAIAELKTALRLRPHHTPTRRLLDRLLQGLPPTVPKAPSAPSATVRAEPPPAPDVSLEAVNRFIVKVQPILMNACAKCHTNGHGGAFKLMRAYYDSSSVDRRVLHYNLAAVVKYIDPAHPQESPFLGKAVSAHGELVRPPLKDRNALAYQELEKWVLLTLNTTPSLAAQARRVEPVDKARSGSIAMNPVPSGRLQPVAPDTLSLRPVPLTQTSALAPSEPLRQSGKPSLSQPVTPGPTASDTAGSSSMVSPQSAPAASNMTSPGSVQTAGLPSYLPTNPTVPVTGGTPAPTAREGPPAMATMPVSAAYAGSRPGFLGGEVVSRAAATLQPSTPINPSSPSGQGKPSQPPVPSGKPQPKTSTEAWGTQPSVVVPPAVYDPYDPLPFNQEMHPDRGSK